MYSISFWFVVFFLFSVLGYFLEVIYCYIMSGELINRGFLKGPYCPIYGAGGICILFLLKNYKDDPIIIFVFGLIICSVIEYLTSYIMEKLFNNKWWDYSDKKFNINGRVCLLNSVLFGIAGVAVVYFFFPLVSQIIKLINKKLLIVLSIILLIIFLVDLTFTIIEVNKFNNQIKIINKIRKEFVVKIPILLQKKINHALEKYKSYSKRIINAFPHIKINQEKNIKLLIKAIKENKNKR